MVDLREIKNKRHILLAAAQKLLDDSIEANRPLDKNGQEEYDHLRSQIEDYNEQIRIATDFNETEELSRDPVIPIQTVESVLDSGSIVRLGGDYSGENRGFGPKGIKNGHRNFGEFVQDCRWEEFRAKRAMSMSIGSTGGFMVADDHVKQIFEVTPERSIVRSRATVLPVNSSAPDAKTDIPCLDAEQGEFGGIALQWLSEGGTKPETEPEFYQVTLEPKEVAGYTIITDKLLRNDAGSASAFLERVFRSAAFAEEDYQFLNGDGVGKPLGVLNSDCRIEVARDTASTFKFADIGAMMEKFMPDSWSRGIWLINQSVLPQLISMVDAGSHRVWGVDTARSLPPSIYGMPLIVTGRTPTLGNTGDVMLLDLSYYLIKPGSGPFVLASPHIYFTSNKTVVKVFYNVDGHPWLRAPVTLKDGSTEVSPFVVLE